ncbi:MAG: oligoendopeptidase, partial [Deinococcus sp.]|nr:oligoendopeptidase [Deinococcus sp.]
MTTIQPSVTLPKRHEVPREQTWDIEAMYATPQAWEADAEALPADIDAMGAYAGTLGHSSAALLAYLTAESELELRLTRFFSYASMNASVDGRDAEAAARRDRASGIAARYGSVTAFARPELLALEEFTLTTWMMQPELEPFRIRLQRILRQKPHVRSAEVEELLGAVQAPFASERGIHPALVNMDLRFGTAGGTPVTQGNVDRLTTDPDREIRRQAWEGYADAHLAVQHAQAAAYSTNVRQNVFLARARRYPDAITATLAPDQIPTAVVTTLLDTYRAHTPTWHRYWKVRREWLNLPELREYDVKAALVPPVPVDYAQAVEWLAEGMAPLGPYYLTDMRAGLTTER